MNIKLRSTLAACAMLVASSGPALALNLVQISGAKADFYYDADFWGMGAATVTGDTISLVAPPAYFTQVTVGSEQGYRSETYSDTGVSNVVVIAKTGYVLSGELTAAVSGAYAVGANNSSAIISADGAMYQATISGGAVQRDGYLGYFATQAQQFSSGAPAVGTFGNNATASLLDPPGKYQGILLDGALSLSATENGIGSSSSRISDVSYAFVLTAVPEPEQYLLFLMGALVVAGAARARRNGNR